MPRILIADRDEAIASLLQSSICRVIECDVCFAHDPDTAADALRSDVFDLVLLDIGMYSGGLDTLAHVRGRNAQCEVIALTTGAIVAPLLKQLAEADVFAVMTKPFDINQLTDLVVESLRADREARPNHPFVYRTVGSKPTRE